MKVAHKLQNRILRTFRGYNLRLEMLLSRDISHPIIAQRVIIAHFAQFPLQVGKALVFWTVTLIYSVYGCV